MPKKKDYLIIDRSKWRTATSGRGDTMLLNDEGYMCCLGFRCHQMGIPEEDLLDISHPEDVFDWNIPDLVKKRGGDTAFTTSAININDDKCLTSKEREQELIEHFATKDIIVEFTGKYKKQ